MLIWHSSPWYSLSMRLSCSNWYILWLYHGPMKPTPTFWCTIREYTIIITIMYLIPIEDRVNVYRMKIYWEVAKLAHFVLMLLMFEMIPNVSAKWAWHHTIHMLFDTTTQLHLVSGWKGNQNTDKYLRFFKFQLPKSNLHQLWILLIVRCISNVLLNWIT